MTLLGWYMAGFVCTFVLWLFSLQKMIEHAKFTITGTPTKKQKFQIVMALFINGVGKSAIWPVALPYDLYLVAEGWQPKVAFDYPEQTIPKFLKTPAPAVYSRDMQLVYGLLERFLEKIDSDLEKKLGHVVDPTVYCDALLHAAHHAFAHATREQLGEEADRVGSFAARARAIASIVEDQLAKKTNTPAEQAPSEQEARE